jgi:ketosteroid isomerase-like protein
MSKHLETLRRGHDAFNRGDISEARELFAEDVDWGTTGNWPGIEGSYQGREGLEDWVAAQRREFGEFKVSVHEVLHDEADAVAVAEHLRGVGRESGAVAEMTVYAVYWFDADGLVARRRAFTSAEEALAAI